MTPLMWSKFYWHKRKNTKWITRQVQLDHLKSAFIWFCCEQGSIYLCSSPLKHKPGKLLPMSELTNVNMILYDWWRPAWSVRSLSPPREWWNTQHITSEEKPERSEPNLLKRFYPCNESFTGDMKQLKEILSLKVIAVESFEQQEFSN